MFDVRCGFKDELFSVENLYGEKLLFLAALVSNFVEKLYSLIYINTIIGGFLIIPLQL